MQLNIISRSSDIWDSVFTRVTERERERERERLRESFKSSHVLWSYSSPVA